MIVYLSHTYSSQYYDPVKAHDYYERTKKLKGRKTTSLSEEGRKVWAVSKDNISTEKKAKVETTQDNRDAQIEKLREDAAQVRERITQKLREILEQITEQTQDEREDISEKVQREIDALPDLPKGASDEEREARRAEIAKIRGDAQNERKSLSKESRTEKDSERSSASEEREAVRATVKGAISAAREAYKKAKTQIDADFETIFQEEFDKILSAMPYIKKSRRRSY